MQWTFIAKFTLPPVNLAHKMNVVVEQRVFLLQFFDRLLSPCSKNFTLKNPILFFLVAEILQHRSTWVTHSKSTVCDRTLKRANVCGDRIAEEKGGMKNLIAHTTQRENVRKISCSHIFLHQVLFSLWLMFVLLLPFVCAYDMLSETWRFYRWDSFTAIKQFWQFGLANDG